MVVYIMLVVGVVVVLCLVVSMNYNKALCLAIATALYLTECRPLDRALLLLLHEHFSCTSTI